MRKLVFATFTRHVLFLFLNREIFHSVRINIVHKLLTLKSRIVPIYPPQELFFINSFPHAQNIVKIINSANLFTQIP